MSVFFGWQPTTSILRCSYFANGSPVSTHLSIFGRSNSRSQHLIGIVGVSATTMNPVLFSVTETVLTRSIMENVGNFNLQIPSNNSIILTLIATTPIKGPVTVGLASSTGALYVVPSKRGVRGSSCVLTWVRVVLGEEGWVCPELVLLESQEGLTRLGGGGMGGGGMVKGGWMWRNGLIVKQGCSSVRAEVLGWTEKTKRERHID